MNKKIKKELKMIGLETNMSQPEIDAIISEENKKRKRPLTLETKVTSDEVDQLYKKYFGVNLKNKI
ncbi:MAG: hypothetical protein Q8N08_04030 [Methanobacteriaceae archaeon]|nr:hypothetical protein [Methanobacteriaceae archaeon]